jgi:hypothetical protein
MNHEKTADCRHTLSGGEITTIFGWWWWSWGANNR